MEGNKPITSVVVSFASIVSLLQVGCLGQFITDPCDDRVYYELDEPYRSTGFVTRSPAVPLCDDHLRRGWYRFINRAGGEMPTTCQESGRCGTQRPAWLDGTHPAIDEGIVLRHICVNLNNSDPNAQPCCEENNEMFVKNCSGFYVYFLYPATVCPMSYCAGDIPPCPVGKWSNTSFPPCRDMFPVMDAPPILTGPHMHADKTVDFKCEVVFGPDDPDQVFEVVWIFNDREDPSLKRELLSGSNKVAILDGAALKRHVDTRVSCQVRSYYTEHPHDISNFTQSNTTFFGIQTKPSLIGPIVYDGGFEYQCQVVDDFDNSDIEFEVTWTFDGRIESVITPEIVTSPDNMTLTLDGTLLKGLLNKKIGCQARLVFQGNKIWTRYLTSNLFFVGIQIGPSSLTLSEADFLKYVTLTSTIPLTCDNSSECCLAFSLHTSEISGISFLNTCEQKICSSDWDPQKNSASLQIGLVPTKDIVRQGNRLISITLNDFILTGSGSYADLFTGLGQDLHLQVNLEDKPAFSCLIYTDPHITLYDRGGNDFSTGIGDYTAYEAPDRNFAVHIRNAPCSTSSPLPACTCGIVIREGNDIIKIHGCDQPRPWKSATIHVAYNLSDGTVVSRSSDGKRFGVFLPSGAEVKYVVTTTNARINIITPASDFGKARGLCGTPDGNRDNDCMARDGTIHPACGRPFTDTWRETASSSFFETVPDPITVVTVSASEPKYCTCSGNGNVSYSVSCSPRGHIKLTGTTCHRCVDITRSLVPSYQVGTGWLPDPYGPSTSYVLPNESAQDLVFHWPTASGILQSDARDMCTKAVQKAQLYSHCQAIGNITASLISDCMTDILMSDSTHFVDGITAQFTAHCQMTVAQDPTSYVTNVVGGLVLKDEFLNNICPSDCFHHGTCGQGGHCVCEPGWEGETCHLESGKGPQMHLIHGGPTCDTTQRSCVSIYIDVSNINLSYQLQCLIQPLDENGAAIGTPFTTKAVFLTSNRIMCPLPQLGISFQRYTISATNDGLLYGNSLSMSVFDSTCITCDAYGCNAKTSACHIDKRCYQNGYTEIKTCDISQDTTKWTYTQSLDNHSSSRSNGGPGAPFATASDIKPCPFCVGKK